MSLWPKPSTTRWLALAALLMSCRGGGKQPVFIFGVEDRSSDAPEGVRLEEPVLHGSLWESLRKSSLFRPVAEDESQHWRAQLTVRAMAERETEESEEGRERSLLLELVLWKKVDGDEELRLRASGLAVAKHPRIQGAQEGFQELLEQALRQAVELLELQWRARSLPEAELEELLHSPEARVRLQALRALRERRVPRLAGQVAELLRDADAEVVLEAIGVLVAWRQRDAVGPIIRSATGKDILYQAQVLTSLGEIGGPEARGYLFTVAAGHGSPHLRELAREQLEKLTRPGQEADATHTAERAAESH